MYYIDILNAKREALTVARNNCKAALDSICEDQAVVFDKGSKQLAAIDKMLRDCENELTLLDWCRV